MHRLGDVVDVRLVEAAPVAGALRFELLSEGRVVSRGRPRSDRLKVRPALTKGHDPKQQAKAKPHPGRSPNGKSGKPRKGKSGKSGKGKSW
jgi:ribonuclease R